MPVHSNRIAILIHAEHSGTLLYILSLEEPQEQSKDIAVMQVAKNITIPSETESTVIFLMPKRVSITIERSNTDKLDSLLIAALVVHNTDPNIPFGILATNFSKNLIILHKSTVIDQCSVPPEFIVKSQQWND